MKTFKLLSIFLAALFFTIACEEAPQQEIDAANTALTDAKTAEAERYATSEFNMAKDTLNAALAEIEEQNAAFALTRSYDKAKQLLSSATTLAAQANEAAVANKEKVKAEVEMLMTEVKDEIANTQKLLKKAPKGKDGKMVLQAMTQELSTVEGSLGNVESLYNSGNYLSAKDNLMAAKQKVLSLQEELNTAISRKR